MNFHHCYKSPLGELLLTGKEKGDHINLTGIYFENHRHVDVCAIKENSCLNPEKFSETIGCLDNYFKTGRINPKNLSKDLPKMLLSGTDFQKAVWNQLLKIPSSATTTYSNLAIKLGKPNSQRAVGSAVGKNPISILIPCHRVLGSGGKLTGYAGGLTRKMWLLEHEQRNLKNESFAEICSSAPKAAQV